MADKKYEDILTECAETRRDLDVVYHPTFGNIKKAFAIIFGSSGFTGAEFKGLSDLVYYQGGYPNPDSKPKAQDLGDRVAKLLLLEEIAGKSQLQDVLAQHGIKITIDTTFEEEYRSSLSDKEDKKLRNAWEGAGIDAGIPASRFEALTLLLERSQNLQKYICQQADTIKVDAAEQVESAFKIAKPNFIKAVGLAALKLRKGEGPVAEKIDDIEDRHQNLEDALVPLKK